MLSYVRAGRPWLPFAPLTETVIQSTPGQLFPDSLYARHFS
jgi:hypothetical protein